jgi:hypothetical protein
MTAHTKAWPFQACRPTSLPSAFGSCSQLLMFRVLLTNTEFPSDWVISPGESCRALECNLLVAATLSWSNLSVDVSHSLCYNQPGRAKSDLLDPLAALSRSALYNHSDTVPSSWSTPQSDSDQLNVLSDSIRALLRVGKNITSRITYPGLVLGRGRIV